LIDKVRTEINEDAPLDKELGTLLRKALKNDKQNQSTSQIEYNMHMGGVDLFDQKVSYSMERNTCSTIFEGEV